MNLLNFVLSRADIRKTVSSLIVIVRVACVFNTVSSSDFFSHYLPHLLKLLNMLPLFFLIFSRLRLTALALNSSSADEYSFCIFHFPITIKIFQIRSKRLVKYRKNILSGFFRNRLDERIDSLHWVKVEERRLDWVSKDIWVTRVETWYGEETRVHCIATISISFPLAIWSAFNLSWRSGHFILLLFQKLFFRC